MFNNQLTKFLKTLIRNGPAPGSCCLMRHTGIKLTLMVQLTRSRRAPMLSKTACLRHCPHPSRVTGERSLPAPANTVAWPSRGWTEGGPGQFLVPRSAVIIFVSSQGLELVVRSIPFTRPIIPLMGSGVIQEGVDPWGIPGSSKKASFLQQGRPLHVGLDSGGPGGSFWQPEGAGFVEAAIGLGSCWPSQEGSAVMDLARRPRLKCDLMPAGRKCLGCNNQRQQLRRRG